MIVGVPKETKKDEYRVAMIPAGVEELVRRGHHVLVETHAGVGSGISDDEYAEQGAEIAAHAADVFARAELIVKVKEPQPEEWQLIREGQIIFTYFHFAADRELTDAMIKTGSTSIAYETLTDKQGRLP
ncbi:MAG TPA: alanine dehydrogenase, partial [Pirellulaceae bacterium]